MRDARPASSRDGGAGAHQDIILSERDGAKVYLVDGNQVLKTGTRVLHSEVVAMDLLKNKTSLSLPLVMRTDFEAQPAPGYIWMSLVPGQTLDKVWDRLGTRSKEELCRDIWAYIAKLRTIPRPPEFQSYFQCSADGSVTRDPLLEDLNTPRRPILGDDALRQRIYQRYRHHNGQQDATQFVNMLPRSSASVFTHGDIAPRNIMVNDKFQITGVLDWECAGWYPHYWEYANIMGPACACGDWQQFMDMAVPDAYKCDLYGITLARKVLF